MLDSFTFIELFMEQYILFFNQLSHKKNEELMLMSHSTKVYMYPVFVYPYVSVCALLCTKLSNNKKENRKPRPTKQNTCNE